MERNWLIRTHLKQILGPVSKQKLLEFIQKGSIAASDEVSSGNGYWFFLKEKDLVDKYLYGDVPQSFNPVSESKTVLAHRKDKDKTTSLNASPPNNRLTDRVSSGPVILPKEEDLEYPDMSTKGASEPAILPKEEDLEYPDVTLITEQVADYPDITILSHLPSMPDVLKKEQEKKQEKEREISVEEAAAFSSVPQVFPSNEDLEFPDLSTSEPPKEIQVETPVQAAPQTEIVEPPPVRVKTPSTPKPDTIALYERKAKVTAVVEPEPVVAPEKDPAPSQPRVVSKELEKRNDNYLIVIFFVLLIILFGIFYYYREILNKPLPI